MFDLLQILFSKNLIKLNEILFFEYTNKKDRIIRFEASVCRNGLKLENGKILSPSNAAISCILSCGEHCSVNGWLLWKNKQEKTLSELYSSTLNLSKFTIHQSEKPKFETFTPSPERDTVFVLGARAATGTGHHNILQQRHILPEIFKIKHKQLLRNRLFKEVKFFIEESFGCGLAEGNYPPLEAVFSFIDYLLDMQESLGGKFNLSKLVEIREYLISLIQYVVHLQEVSNDVSSLASFWQLISQVNPNVSIISLNYDALLSKAFDTIYPLNFYLDYCCDLVNYNYNFVEHNDIWVNPKKPLINYENIPAQVIKIIKLHGDLSWLYCNCCRQLKMVTEYHSILKPWGKSHAYKCLYDNTPLVHLIVPPAQKKEAKHVVIGSLMSEATKELIACRRIVLIGYSLPDADVDIRALLMKAQVKQKQCIVVNPDKSEAFRSKFLTLCPETEFIPMTFEALLSDKVLFSKLIEPMS